MVDLVMENGAEFLSISFENKKALLFSLHEASRMELPDDWEGVPADELMMQLATIWEIELQQFKK
uniref:TORTIFOLIA1/TORL1-2 C-terminal domain-containing protein n=1 Tax=Nymphaea colorata TaxID=210225 RepID=A0A5K0Y3I6_9MAGN